MNILIVSNSFVVEELLKLILKEKNNLEMQEDVEDAKRDSYDIIFIDDSVQNIVSQIEYAQNSLNTQVAFTTSIDSDIKANYIVVKPFLPQDIENIIEQLEEKNIDSLQTNVLDPEEIAKIKELMQLDEELEESKENINIQELLKAKISLKAKKKEAKELLLELCDLDKKDLKKLLKGAKVSIKIAYKKSEDE